MSTEAKTEPTITEADLQKTLEKLEGKKVVPTPAADPKVVTAELKKAAATVEKGASQPLRKAIDASSVLREVVEHLGLHVDESLEVLQKSIQAAAERDSAVIRVLEKFGERIETLAKAVEKFGNQPGPSKATQPVTAKPEEVLNKTAGEPEKQTGQPSRRVILAALESLTKTAVEKNDPEVGSLIHATSTYEATGKMSDAVLVRVMREIKKAQAA